MSTHSHHNTDKPSDKALTMVRTAGCWTKAGILFAFVHPSLPPTPFFFCHLCSQLPGMVSAMDSGGEMIPTKTGMRLSRELELLEAAIVFDFVHR